MQNSPLGRLASELRNGIYEHALISSNPLRITAAFPDGKLYLDQRIPAKSHSHPTALLQVCHQLRAECSQLFYSSNKFAIASDALCPSENRDEFCTLTRFQATIGSVNHAAIRTIIVEIVRTNLGEGEVFYDLTYGLWQFETIDFLCRLRDFEAMASQNPHCKMRLNVTFGWKASAEVEMMVGRHPFNFTPISFDLKMCPEWFAMSRAVAKVKLEEELRLRIGFSVAKPVTLHLLIGVFARYRKRCDQSCT